MRFFHFLSKKLFLNFQDITMYIYTGIRKVIENVVRCFSIWFHDPKTRMETRLSPNELTKLSCRNNALFRDELSGFQGTNKL